jgi:hypothetical protein
MRRPTRNEYGIKLDKNGYAPTLFPCEDDICYRCRSTGLTVRHEIYGGALRSKSKQFGLWINVCPQCHAAIHKSGEKQDYYHRLGQYRAMAYYHWTVSDFRRRFYKNYLDITED